MVNEYNARAARQGFSPTQMSATHGDLLGREKPSPSVSGPDFYDFDLAVVDLGFRHFEDPALAAKRLVERLKPGKGVLLIVDFVRHAHGKHGGAHAAAHHGGGEDGEKLMGAATHTIAHHGFAREEIEGMLRGAGCVDMEYVVLEEPLRLGDEMEGQERTAFMIRGRRQG
jgi:SAM-dependent methyltransferase